MTIALFNEILRKAIHISSVIIPLAYFFFIKDRTLMIFILLVLTMVSLLIEYHRIKNKGRARYFFQTYLQPMLRPEEKRGHFTGATWMMIGFTIAVLIFDIDVAVFSLLFLSLGDSAAGLLGRAFPIGKIWNKSILGSLSGFIISIIVVYAINVTLPLQIIIFGAISAMLIELIPLKINDNLSIPIFSGVIMQILKETL